jgi:hypothetical protein
MTNKKKRARQMGGLRPASELAADKPHGTRIKYRGGCKCMLCRAANSSYETERAALRRQGLSNGIVSAKRARTHILKLSDTGVGRRAIGKAAGVRATTIKGIRDGVKKRIRKDTERKILAVSFERAARPKTFVSAGPAWELIDILIEEHGYSKAQIAARLGYKTANLQLNKKQITVANAVKVQRLFYSTRELK